MILDYQSGQQVLVRQLSGDLYECRGLLEDTLFSAEVVLRIGVPGFDIREADFTIKRCFAPPPENLKENFPKLIGVRAGQGLTRIVKGLIGGPEGSSRLAQLVLDTAEGLILSFTTIPLRAAMSGSGIPNPDPDEIRLNPRIMDIEHIRIMGEQNPRLKDSCIAFRLD